MRVTLQYPSSELKPVHFTGHPYVREDEVYVGLGEYHFNSFIRVPCLDNLEAAVFEVLANLFPDEGFILDDQNGVPMVRHARSIER